MPPLWFCAKHAQTQRYVAEEHGLPLNKTAMEAYYTRYPFAESLEPFLVYSNEDFTALPADFVQGLEEIVAQNDDSWDAEAVLQYCTG